MYDRWHDKSDHDVTAKKASRCRQGIGCWPTGVLGWIRIPSLVVGIAGILGILKYMSPRAARLLKSLNLPSIEFCWIMLAVAIVVYLLCIVYWLSPKDITDIYDQPDKKASAASGRWRSL
jgi:protein-S-isoprenylcysteine O-methyltransferase Ste14